MKHLTNSIVVSLFVSTSFGLSATRSSAVTLDLSWGNGFDDGSNAEHVLRRNVAKAAAKWWENSILTDFNVDINVGFADLSGERAVGRVHSNQETTAINPLTGTRLPTSATLELNSMTKWFFDPTPYFNTEFNLTQENGLYGLAKNELGNPAKGIEDALSTLLHEMGHILGFIGDTGIFKDKQPFTAYKDFANNLNKVDGKIIYEFDSLKQGKEGSKGTKITLDGYHHVQGSTRLINRGGAIDERSLPTPLEIDILGDAFNLEIDDMPILTFTNRLEWEEAVKGLNLITETFDSQSSSGNNRRRTFESGIISSGIGQGSGFNFISTNNAYTGALDTGRPDEADFFDKIQWFLPGRAFAFGADFTGRGSQSNLTITSVFNVPGQRQTISLREKLGSNGNGFLGVIGRNVEGFPALVFEMDKPSGRSSFDNFFGIDNFTYASTEVTVTQPFTASVPEPATTLGLGLSMGLMGYLKKKQSRKLKQAKSAG
ncbi:MAG: PEP-CTERM sorting domain-containing protein [Symploca sp. SIO3E6]|nr:PEP-CTERM sorting domain-containing protein [Caldora sp. SIO3E6]